MEFFKLFRSACRCCPLFNHLFEPTLRYVWATILVLLPPPVPVHLTSMMKYNNDHSLPLWTLALHEKHYLQNLHDFANTIMLFTYSDLKTILFPVTVFALAASRNTTSLERLPQIVAWIWLHLLQFCISNQCSSPDEDALNKPWRPIPAGRISLENAQYIRWALLPACLLISAYLDVFWPSVLLSVTFWAHEEGGTHGHWLPRNLSNVAGYCGFEWGATSLACAARGCALDDSAMYALALNALIIFTTIDAQDYRDEEGDKLRGRRTLPIIFPEASRWMTAFALCAWSVFLAVYWTLPILAAVPLMALGASVATRFICWKTPEADGRSYVYYNIWLCGAQILPFCATLA